MKAHGAGEHGGAGGEARRPRERRSDGEDDERRGNPTPRPQAAEEEEEGEPERDDPDDRMGEEVEEEVERQECESRAGQRREERRPRRHPAQALGHERAEELDHAGAQAGDEAGLPGGGVGVRRAARQRNLPGREHHEEGVGDHRRRVQAERHRADVRAVLAAGEPVGLPGVEKVSRYVGHGDPGEDAAVDHRRGHAHDPDAEGRDQQDLDKVVERDGEEPVHVAPDEELHRLPPASSATSETAKSAAWRDANGESFL